MLYELPAVASVDQLQEWFYQKDFKRLAEFAFHQLLKEDLNGKSDYRSSLSISLCDPKTAESLWRCALARCSTLKAVENYLKASARNARLKSNMPECVQDFRSRVRRVLREDVEKNGNDATFSRDFDPKSPRQPYYGLRCWESESVACCIKVKGRFLGPWTNISRQSFEAITDKPIKRNVTFQIHEGCTMLLNVAQAFATPRTLSDGLSQFDLVETAALKISFRIPIEEIAKNNGLQGRSIQWPVAEDEIWSEYEGLADLLSERQRVVAHRYTFPRWVKEKKSVTLHDLGAELRVSHATIAIEDKRITSIVHDFLKPIVMRKNRIDEESIEFSIFLKFLENVIENGWNGHPSA